MSITEEKIKSAWGSRLMSRVGMRTGAAALAMAAALGTVALTGCSSSGSSKPVASAPASDSPVGQVTSSFVTFFSGTTSTAGRVALLQNGSAFSGAISAQESSALARSSTVTVSKVVLSSPDQAAVTYTVLLGGSPALKDQAGVAYRINGVWQVSASTFCALLTLEGSPPAACHEPSVTSAPSS